MKKIIFLIIVFLLVGYAWFGLYKEEIHGYLLKIEADADKYINNFKTGSQKVDQTFNDISDKYLDNYVASINEQVKQKIVDWLVANNKMSTSTATSLTEGLDGYKKVLIENPQLLEYLESIKK